MRQRILILVALAILLVSPLTFLAVTGSIIFFGLVSSTATSVVAIGSLSAIFYYASMALGVRKLVALSSFSVLLIMAITAAVWSYFDIDAAKLAVVIIPFSSAVLLCLAVALRLVAKGSPQNRDAFPMKAAIAAVALFFISTLLAGILDDIAIVLAAGQVQIVSFSIAGALFLAMWTNNGPKLS